MKRLLIVLLALFLAASPVLAAIVYTADIQVTENGTAAYTMLPVKTSISGTALVTGNYITTAGTDLQVKLAGTAIPRMLADDKLMFAMPVAKNSSQLAQLSTANGATDFAIIPGYGGNFYVPYNVNMALGNNFSTEIRGYIDTTGTIGQYGKFLIDQTGGFRMGALAGQVYAEIMDHTNQISQAADDTPEDCYGANWSAQTFTATAFSISRVRIYVVAFGTPAADTVVSIRATAAGLPTGADLASFTVSAGLMGAGWNYFLLEPPLDLTNGVVYAAVIREPSATVTDLWCMRYNSVGGYAGGQHCASTDSGATWTPASGDLRFEIDSAPVVSGAVASGLKTISAVRTGTEFKLWVPSYFIDTITTTSTAPDPGVAWYFMQGNSASYLDWYYHANAVGTPVAQYWPVNIISGTTLPDVVGTYNATINFGNNPGGVAVTVGSLVPATSSMPSDVGTPGAAGVLNEPGGMYPADAAMEGTTNLFYPAVKAAVDFMGLPIQLGWWFLYLFCVLAAFAGVYRVAPNALLAAVAVLVVTGAFVAGSLLPWWLLLVLGIGTLAMALMESRAAQ